MKRPTYYRPIWTCGKFDPISLSAIFYNLITGISFFFDSYSAKVIGKILRTPRNGEISVDEIALDLNISRDSLEPFFLELDKLGIVSSVYPTPEVVANYRTQTSIINRQQVQATYLSTQENLPYTISDAERLYSENVGGITSVMFELTYNCSERCIHCYNKGATRNEEEINTRGNREHLTFNEYKRIIDDLSENGLIKVSLSGGDPFSYPHIWKIIDYLYKKDIAFDLYTNGQNIVAHTQRLADYFPRLVGISIYSGIPEVHDYITRKKGSWKCSMSVVKELSALAVPLNLKCCVFRPNVKSYYMIVDIAKQYGAVPKFDICLTDSVDGDRCASKYLRMTEDELEIVLRDENIPLYVGKEVANYGGQKKNMEDSPCKAAEHSLCITPEGNVIPCCAFHTLFGNLKDNSISNILNNNKNLEYWRSLSLKDYEECGRHDYCDYCQLCSGNNYIENGTPLKASEVNCSMAKTRYNLAMKMIDGYDPLNGKSIRECLAELSDYIPVRIKKNNTQDYSETRLLKDG